MAIYHLHAKTAQKGVQSAAASFAYIERQGKFKTYTGLVTTGCGHMPTWAEQNPGLYWKAADDHERANGRLFKGIECALPRELDPIQREILVKDFCEKVFSTPEGPLPYSYAIHCDPKNQNPHVHIMASERVNDSVSRSPETWFKRAGKTPEKGGARKTELLKPKEWLQDVRAFWAKVTNYALEEAGLHERIDHRSLEAQGIGLYPTPHIGPQALAIEKKSKSGKSSKRVQQWKEIARDRQVPVEPTTILEKIQTAIKEDTMENNKTFLAVRRQLDAMGCEKYEVGLFDPKKGIKTREWTKEEILKNIPFLRAQNAQGENVFIRPAAGIQNGLVLVDDIPYSKMLKLQDEDRYHPACVIETSPANFQLWFKIAETGVSDQVRSSVAKALAQELGGDKASAEKRHFGRLAGFTNRKEKYRTPDGKFPFVLCHYHAGSTVESGLAQQLIQDAEQSLRPQPQASTGKKRLALPKPSEIRSPDHLVSLFQEHFAQWRRSKEREGCEVDCSAGDFVTCCWMLKNGWREEEVLYACYFGSPGLFDRKGVWVEDYSVRTVENAWETVSEEIRAAEEEDEEEDNSLRPGR